MKKSNGTGAPGALFCLAAACGPGGDKGDTASDSGDTVSDSGDTASDSGDTASDSGETVPAVLSIKPLDGATDVGLNTSASAVFSEAMAAETLTTGTFLLSTGAPATRVAGTVIYADGTAVFWPAAHLASGTLYTATLTTGAQSAAGVALAEDVSWSFTTGEILTPGLGVDLGAAGDFAVLAKTGISTVPTSDITGDIGVSPAAASYITGFSLTMDATNVFATSPQVTGKVFASDYAPPTPANLTTAVGDMERAYTDAAGRAPDVTDLGAGNIGGMTLAPGVYTWSTGLLIPTDLTLSGGATGVWIFQIAQDLTLASGTSVLLTGGALPENITWQVAGQVTVGTTAHVEGAVLTQTSIALGTGASIHGRLLAQTSADLDSSTVVAPSP